MTTSLGILLYSVYYSLGMEEAVAGSAGEGGEASHPRAVDGAEHRGGLPEECINHDDDDEDDKDDDNVTHRV